MTINETFIHQNTHTPRTFDKPTLLLDMDGPLVNFDKAVWNFINHRGYEIALDSLDDPRRKRFMTENMPNMTEREQVRKTINTSRWFRDLPITPGALSGVRDLQEIFDIWVCTKPLEVNRTCRDDKATWLNNFFPRLVNKLIIAPTKSFIHGDILLDDAPSFDCIDIATWKPVLFPDVFNIQIGTGWEDLPRWTWGDDPEDLLSLV